MGPQAPIHDSKRVMSLCTFNVIIKPLRVRRRKPGEECEASSHVWVVVIFDRYAVTARHPTLPLRLPPPQLDNLSSECTPVCVWTCYMLFTLFVELVWHETRPSSRTDLCCRVIAQHLLWCVTSKWVLSAFTCRFRYFRSCYRFKRLVCFHTFPVLKDESALNSALV